MWVLKKINNETTNYLISEKKSYTVGRKNCDFTFDEDFSVSRKHCTLFIARKNECPFEVNTTTGVWLVDEQSKYGTFFRNNNTWVKIKPSQNFKLSPGCIIKFGLMENIWRVEYKLLIVCTSGIQMSEKNKIECILKSVDGELRNSWCKSCSLLVVNKITLTVKVVLALILSVPIVTPNYIEKLVDSIKKQTALPKFEDYRPEIKESVLDASLVSLDPKNGRKELFKNKTFLIPTKKQLETLKEVIVSAGGRAELLSLNDSWLKFAEENTILIQSPLNDSTVPESLIKSIKEVARYLQNKHNKRIIPESEIAQAVAYSSTEKYCNPRSNCYSLKRVQEIQAQGDILVEETPEMVKEKIPDPCFVPNSATFNSELEKIFEPHCSKILNEASVTNTTSVLKRGLSPVQLEEYQTKKQKKNEKPAQNIINSISENNMVKEKPPNKTKKPASERVNISKSSDISNYFIRMNKSTEKIQPTEPDNSDFWNYENCTLKRKSSTESNADGETSRKKAKFPEENKQSSEDEINTPREVVEVVRSKNSEAPLVRKTVEEEKDFSDYFGKDMDDAEARISELDNTIFSLTLIPPAYLKADGSLTEPPGIPVNVKKFKKQKVQSVVIEDEEDDLSDGEWIEPHPRVVTVGEKNW